MRVYLDLGNIIGGAVLATKENLQPLVKQWYYSHKEICSTYDKGIIDKVIGATKEMGECVPRVNEGEYYCVIGNSSLMILFSGKGANRVLKGGFLLCHDDLKNDKGELLMPRAEVFCINELFNVFRSQGVFEKNLGDIVVEMISDEVIDQVRNFIEISHGILDKERTRVHAPPLTQEKSDDIFTN